MRIKNTKNLSSITKKDSRAILTATRKIYKLVGEIEKHGLSVVKACRLYSPTTYNVVEQFFVSQKVDLKQVIKTLKQTLERVEQYNNKVK